MSARLRQLAPVGFVLVLAVVGFFVARDAQGGAEVLPWLILAAGLVLAALAGALGVISTRRAKAKAEADRLFAISPDLIVVTSFDGYFKRVNPAVVALLGYTEQETLTRPYIEFVHPEDRERTIAEANEINRGEITVSFENRYVCKDGSVKWIEWTVAPVVEERLRYAVGRDVTGRHEAESKVARLAEEQAALRRVATLVARGVPQEDLFAGVTEEVAQLLPVSSAAMGRYEADGMFTTVAAWSPTVAAFPVGKRWLPEGKNVMTIVFETGRPARMDSFADASGPVGLAAREAGYRSAVGTPIMVEGRLWGVMTAASTAEEPLPPETEARLASFTELVGTAIANAESRAALGVLADEQAALRRVATLVAHGASPTEVFAVVAEEVARFVSIEGARIIRYEDDGSATVITSWSEAAAIPPGLDAGSRLTLDGESLSALVLRTGRPARIDYANAQGSIGVLMRRHGYRSGAGAPIVVDGRLWGVMSAVSTRPEPLPVGLESRIAQFTELVAMAIANAESHAGLARLAEEQAALRRIATLVAEGVPPAKVFEVLCEEVNRLVDAQATTISRLEPDGRVEIVGITGAAADETVLGARLESEALPVTARVLQTGRPARKDDYGDVLRRHGVVRDLSIRSGVGVPIVVEGALWGAIGIGTVRERFPEDTERRLEKFTELAATAIANAESRSELIASRARVVAAADEARRQIERDLHDGTQQRLVSIGLALRAAEANVPTELGELRAELASTAEGLAGAVEDLQEISRGIHPGILSRGGIASALETLAGRAPLPVQLDTRVQSRLPPSVEVAVYYVVSEALTNAAKHAQASAVEVDLRTEDSSVEVTIRDDGTGGADPGRGSGLLGLRDRVEALGGTIEITSNPGFGTSLRARIPTNGVDDPTAPRVERLDSPSFSAS